MSGYHQGLVAEQISRHFKGVKAVDGVSFRLRPGEILALVGPNGAGKSTIIQLVSRVEKLSGGRIFLDGARIDKLRPEQVARLGVGRSFQTSRIFPALSVADSVSLGAQPHLLRLPERKRMVNPLYELLASVLPFPAWREKVRKTEAAVNAALSLFGERLFPRRGNLAYSLSYANRRRLEIARALAGEPNYLLLDEPTAGMNPTETAELALLLLKLRAVRPRLAILAVEHKLSFVRKVADRIIVLNHGRVLAQGAPEAVLEYPEVIDAYLGGAPGAPI
jgi:branched-chain amino acid transport system ATP-binding protein